MKIHGFYISVAIFVLAMVANMVFHYKYGDENLKNSLKEYQEIAEVLAGDLEQCEYHERINRRNSDILMLNLLQARQQRDDCMDYKCMSK